MLFHNVPRVCMLLSLQLATLNTQRPAREWAKRSKLEARTEAPEAARWDTRSMSFVNWAGVAYEDGGNGPFRAQG